MTKHILNNPTLSKYWRARYNPVPSQLPLFTVSQSYTSMLKMGKKSVYEWEYDTVFACRFSVVLIHIYAVNNQVNNQYGEWWITNNHMFLKNTK